MLAAVLVVSLLIFKGNLFGLGSTRVVAPAASTAAPEDSASDNMQFHPVQRAMDVSPMIEEAAQARRKAFEQQLQ